MLGNVYEIKGSEFVYCRTDYDCEAEKTREHRLQTVGYLRDECLSSEELEKVPEMGEDYSENCFEKFRCIP